MTRTRTRINSRSIKRTKKTKHTKKVGKIAGLFIMKTYTNKKHSSIPFDMR